MEALKAILDALGAGGLSNLLNAVISSIGPGGLTAILIIGTFAATRELNKQGPISGEKLIDKLMADLSDSTGREHDCTKQVEILTRRVEILEREKVDLVARFERERTDIEAKFERDRAALEARIDALVSLFQGGVGNIYPKQDESEIARMRRWMLLHMDQESLYVASADADLSKPTGDSLEVQILSVVEEARRKNLLPKLSSVIQARLPTVKPW